MIFRGHFICGKKDRALRLNNPRDIAQGYQSEQRTTQENCYFLDIILNHADRVAINITRTAFHFRWKAGYIFY